MSEKTQKSRTMVSCALLGLLLCLSGTLQAGADGHAQIREAVQEYLHSFHPEAARSAENNGTDPALAHRVDIDIGQLDPRLRIDACAVPLETGMNLQQEPVGRITVRVDCRDPAQAWTRYVPATVRVFEPVLVSTRSIDRGELLSDADMTLQSMDLSRLRQAVLRDPDTARGMEARRRIAAGTPLTHGVLAAPLLIERGDTIILSAQRGTVRIQNQATALQSGELGERINVRNERSNRTMQAIVTGPGEARIEF